MEYLEFNSKNVFWGTKCICKSIDKNGYVGQITKKNALFVKVGKNDYRDVFDLYNANCIWYPKFLVLREPMPHYSTSPKKIGEIFVEELKPLAEENRKMDIVELAFVAANKKNENSLECER